MHLYTMDFIDYPELVLVKEEARSDDEAEVETTNVCSNNYINYQYKVEIGDTEIVTETLLKKEPESDDAYNASAGFSNVFSGVNYQKIGGTEISRNIPTLDVPIICTTKNALRGGSEYIKLKRTNVLRSKPNIKQISKKSITSEHNFSSHNAPNSKPVETSNTGRTPDEDPFSECNKQSQTTPPFEAGKTQTTSIDSYKFSKCNIILKVVNGNHAPLEAHKRTHNRQKLFKCTRCPYTSTALEAIIEHMQTHKNDKPCKCSTCNYIANNPTNLKVHMKTHIADNSYKCNECGFIAIHHAVLKLHKKKHLLLKSPKLYYKCKKCEFTATNSADLQKHLELPNIHCIFACPVCDFSAISSARLKLHMTKHLAEKPFKCEICDYSSRYDSALKLHVKMRKCKPHKCKVCPYATDQPGNLVSHMRAHFDERPHKCTFCTYAARTSAALKCHMTLMSKKGHTNHTLET